MITKKLLENKRVLITGASRGLGAEIAYSMGKEGARIAFNYSKDELEATRTLDRLKQQGIDVLKFKASVTDKAAIEDMFNKIVKKWDGIDILINNAGISQPLALALMSEEDWDNLMDINVKGLYTVTHQFLRSMIRQKYGRILNIGSLAGMRLIEAPSHYSASKAAIKGFTEALSKEIASYNITVNCLAPGLLEDGVSKNLPSYKLDNFIKHVSLHRLGTLEEVAKFATFLVSDLNSYMNGQTILIDGGF